MFTRCYGAYSSHSQELRGEPLLFLITALGYFTIVTEHMGSTALRPIRRTKQRLSVLLKDTSVTAGESTRISCNGCFSSLIMLLQLRGPIGSKFSQIMLFYAYVGIHQVRIIFFIFFVFCCIQLPKVSSAFKGNEKRKYYTRESEFHFERFSELNSRAGRRPTFFVCVTMSLVSATSVSFMPNFASFAAMRFFVAAGNYGIYLMAFILGNQLLNTIGIYLKYALVRLMAI